MVSHRSHSTGIRLDVAQISGMANSRIGRTMILTGRVKMRSCGHASVGVVPKLVDMEAVLASRQSRHLTGHFDLARLRLRSEIKRIPLISRVIA